MQPGFEFLGTADEFTVDEDFGDRGTSGYGAQRRFAVVAVEHQFLELQAGPARLSAAWRGLQLLSGRAAGKEVPDPCNSGYLGGTYTARISLLVSGILLVYDRP